MFTHTVLVLYLRNACRVPAMAARSSALNGLLGAIFSADFTSVFACSSSIRFVSVKPNRA